MHVARRLPAPHVTPRTLRVRACVDRRIGVRSTSAPSTFQRPHVLRAPKTQWLGGGRVCTCVPERAAPVRPARHAHHRSARFDFALRRTSVGTCGVHSSTRPHRRGAAETARPGRVSSNTVCGRTGLVQGSNFRTNLVAPAAPIIGEFPCAHPRLSPNPPVGMYAKVREHAPRGGGLQTFTLGAPCMHVPKVWQKSPSASLT